MGLTAMNPHHEKWERLTVKGMSWISNRDFTRYLFKEWGILLYLIH